MTPSPATISSERRATFPLAPDDLWSVLERVDDYPAWWPWLRPFDGSALRDGERWSATVRPPLPYRVSFDLVLHDVVPASSVAAHISGDITGWARVELTPAVVGDVVGTDLRLVTELAPARPLLRTLSRITTAIPRYGHDQILERGLTQFSARALDGERPR